MSQSLVGVFTASAPGRSAARPSAGRAVTGAALALAVLSVGGYLLLAATRPEAMWWLGDLKVYRAGGRAAAGGGDLYSMTVGSARLPFTYTPWAALSFTPLAWVPWSVLRYAWTAVSLASLAACALLSWRLAGLSGRRALVPATALTAALLLWTDPVQETLRFGQINLVLMLVVLADLSRPDGARAKGAGVGLAAALKLTPAIFIVYLLLTGRRRAAGVATATLLGTTALSAAILPAESARYWGGLFLDDTRVGNVAFPGNQSLRGLLARCLHDMPVPAPVWVPVTVLVTVLGLTVAVAARRHLPGGTGELGGVAVTALTGLLVSPISWTHHWVWVVPGVVVLVVLAARAPARRAWAPLLAVAALLAVPSRRVEIDQFIPTGLVWRVPYRGGRELRLGAAELLVSNTWVLLGVAALLAAGAVALARGRAPGRARHPRGGVLRVRPDESETLPIS